MDMINAGFGLVNTQTCMGTTAQAAEADGDIAAAFENMLSQAISGEQSETAQIIGFSETTDTECVNSEISALLVSFAESNSGESISDTKVADKLISLLKEFISNVKSADENENTDSVLAYLAEILAALQSHAQPDNTALAEFNTISASIKTVKLNDDIYGAVIGDEDKRAFSAREKSDKTENPELSDDILTLPKSDLNEADKSNAKTDLQSEIRHSADTGVFLESVENKFAKVYENGLVKHEKYALDSLETNLNEIKIIPKGENHVSEKTSESVSDTINALFGINDTAKNNNENIEILTKSAEAIAQNPYAKSLREKRESTAVTTNVTPEADLKPADLSKSSVNTEKTADAAESLFKTIIADVKQKFGGENFDTKTIKDEIAALKTQSYNINQIKINSENEFNAIYNELTDTAEKVESSTSEKPAANNNINNNIFNLFGRSPTGGVADTAQNFKQMFDSAPVPVPAQISEQITAKMTSLTNGTTEFDIQLTPEELGKITIKLVAKGTNIALEIIAERPETAELLRNRADSMADALKQSNVQLERYAVYGGNESEQPQSYLNQEGKNQGNKEQQPENHEEQPDDNPDVETISFLELMRSMA